jgi:hypothetical protein
MTAKQTRIANMIAALREAFGKFERMTDVNYTRIAAILDRADNEALLAAAGAEIKFVSPLARNRCVTRGLIVEPPVQWTPETARRRVGGTFGS